MISKGGSFDTCRADLVGVLTGESPSLTPRVDELAADSVVVENAFVQAPHTLPSPMSTFSKTRYGLRTDDVKLIMGLEASRRELYDLLSVEERKRLEALGYVN